MKVKLNWIEGGLAAFKISYTRKILEMFVEDGVLTTRQSSDIASYDVRAVTKRAARAEAVEYEALVASVIAGEEAKVRLAKFALAGAQRINDLLTDRHGIQKEKRKLLRMRERARLKVKTRERAAAAP